MRAATFALIFAGSQKGLYQSDRTEKKKRVTRAKSPRAYYSYHGLEKGRIAGEEVVIDIYENRYLGEEVKGGWAGYARKTMRAKKRGG